MNLRLSNWTPSVLLVGALGALLTVGCGDDGGSTGPATSTDAGGDGGSGAPSSSSTSKPSGSATQSPSSNGDSGGAPAPSNNGGDGSVPVGTDGSTPTDGDGGAVIPPPSGDIDDLIGAICEWEFRCCDSGERAYRFGPSIPDAAECRSRFVSELRESNSSKNPFTSGPAAAGLLASLAYSINLSRVSPNADAISQCTAQYLMLGCNSPAPTEVARCTAGGAASVNPCALDQLFLPKLDQNDACTPGLGQGAEGMTGNDIECVPGTSCLGIDDPANTTGVPACIKRGEAGDFCEEDVDCDFGYYCNGNDGCAEKGDEGDDCTYDDDEGTGVHPNSCKPGLSCDPNTDTCVASCSEGYECSVDAECPSGESCAPTFVGDELFHLCRPLGDGVSAECDDSNDCVEEQYCNVSGGTPGNCATDREFGDDCDGTPGQCETDTYCDGAQCQTYNNPTDPCVPGELPPAAVECAPDTVGCILRFGPDPDPATEGEPDGIAYRCRAELNDVGDDCTADYECASGKCEVVADIVDGHTERTCTLGADEGDDCDLDTTTKDALSCKAGLTCNAQSGKCEKQLLPGEDCEAEAGGTADYALCANASCGEQWNSFICTDAPVPVSAGGTGVTCDGND